MEEMNISEFEFLCENYTVSLSEWDAYFEETNTVKKDTHTEGPMRKKQSTNFIILSLQRHKPLYPQNISLKKKKK